MDTGPAPMQVEASTPAITAVSDATFNVQPLLHGHLPDVIQVREQCILTDMGI